MKLKDIKRIKRLPKNTEILIDGKRYAIELQLDQDGNWSINFVSANKE